MKDELRGMILIADVCLKAKVYSYTYLNEDGKIVEVKKSKGVEEDVVQNKLSFNDYLTVHKTKISILKKQCRFRTYNLQMYTEELNKVSLNNDDDKRIGYCDEKFPEYAEKINNNSCVQKINKNIEKLKNHN